MTDWKRSSFCEAGSCLAVRRLHDGRWQIRDSARPHVIITVEAEEWDAFTAGLRAGDFDTLNP